MVKVIRQGVYYLEGRIETEAHAFMTSDKKAKAIKNTISYAVLKAHGGTEEPYSLRYDAVVAEGTEAADTAKYADSAKLDAFPLPVTFIEGSGIAPQDYLRKAAEKFGGSYLSAGIANASAYLNEHGAKCGEVVLSPSPAAIGAVGAMGFGKDAFGVLKTFFALPVQEDKPEIIAVYLKGKLRKGVGATDVALSMEKALKNDFARGKILEFFGTGVAGLSMDARIAIDAATLKFGRLATVWATDAATEAYYKERGKKGFKKLVPVQPAFYDGGIVVDLTRIEPMIALGEAIYPLKEIVEGDGENLPYDIYDKKITASSVSGSEGGTYENIAEFAEILRGKTVLGGNYRVVPASLSVYKGLADAGYLSALADSGIVVNAPCSCWDEEGVGCGTRESEVRMDSRSIAASILNGTLTSALDLEYVKRLKKFVFSQNIYSRLSVYKANTEVDLSAYGSAKTDALPKNLLLKLGAQKEWDKTAFSVPKNTVCGIAALNVDSDADALALYRESGYYALIYSELTDQVVNDCVAVGILPLKAEKIALKEGDVLYIENVVNAVKKGEERVLAKRYSRGKSKELSFRLPELTEEARDILLAGGFVGYCGKLR